MNTKNGHSISSRGLFLFYCCFILSSCYIQSINSQLSSTGKYRPSVKDSFSIQTYHIPAPTIAPSSSLLNSTKPFQFATSIPVSISFPLKKTSSIKQINAKGDWRWKIRIHSAGAFSLSFIFDKFWIPDGSELYVYNNNQATLGAFTANTSNKSSKQFATTPLTGDSLIIEYIAPAYVNQLPEISLSRVVYGYRRVPFLETSPDLYYPRNRHQQVYLKRRPRRHSGRCNIDLSCDSAGTEWIKEARSVAVLLTNENQMYCTGVLLNNAEQDGRQLLLTAHHCIGSTSANNDIIMFNHQRRTCNNRLFNDQHTTSHSDTLHGLKWLAGSPKSDYALFEIEDPIPKKYNVYLAGWSTVNKPQPPFVGIHHPNGDFKKLSIYNGHLAPTCWSECPQKGHWKVDKWSFGTTEPGSSGSPLFDSNHRVVGQLHGGSAACWNKNGYDIYGAFNTSWQNGLAQYLDPHGHIKQKLATGSINIDGDFLNKIKRKQ